MTELWIPPTEASIPDITNVYDLMTVFQEGLDKHESLNDAILDAMYAVRALNKLVNRMSDSVRDITVGARVAILDSTEEPGKRLYVENDIGLTGTLQEVKAEPLDIDGRGRYHLTVFMDVMTLFPLGRPEEGDPMFRQGSVPISTVDYIETEAA